MSASANVSVMFLFAASAWAQLSVNIKPGAVNYAEGQVYLDEAPLQFSPEKSHEVRKGQFLRTEMGKAEIQLGLAATLWLGEKGRVRMEDSNPTNVRLLVDRGSAFIEVIEKFEHLGVTVHFGDAVADLKEIGFYRLESNPPRLRVYNGLARVLQDRRRAKVKPGKSADLIPRMKVSVFDKNQNDALHVWAAQRSGVLYGRIKQARDAILMMQRLADLRLQRQIEEGLRRESFIRMMQAQANESSRLSRQ